MRDLALAVCALLAFLVPVGSYCFILAIINRRHRPLVVQGYWDTIGLLAAGSGFFLVTIPMLLSELSNRFHGEAAALDWFDAPLRHWLLWIVYLLFLVTGCLWMMLWRIHKTVIYNVDTETFREIFKQAIATVGLEVKTERFGHLTLAAPPPLPDETGFSEQPVRVAPPTMGDVGFAKLQVEPFPALCHVTLHWEDYPEEVRRRIESELDRSLTAPADNPGAGWFLSISGLVFGVLLTITLIILITVWRFRDHG